MIPKSVQQQRRQRIQGKQGLQGKAMSSIRTAEGKKLSRRKTFCIWNLSSLTH